MIKRRFYTIPIKTLNNTRTENNLCTIQWWIVRIKTFKWVSKTTSTATSSKLFNNTRALSTTCYKQNQTLLRFIMKKVISKQKTMKFNLKRMQCQMKTQTFSEFESFKAVLLSSRSLYKSLIAHRFSCASSNSIEIHHEKSIVVFNLKLSRFSVTNCDSWGKKNTRVSCQNVNRVKPKRTVLFW